MSADTSIDEDDSGFAAELADALLSDMREQESDVLDVGDGYVQWQGVPGGLHVEASDGLSYDEPMTPEVVELLARAGWGRPDSELRNCWFQITSEQDIPEAARLVLAAVDILDAQ